MASDLCMRSEKRIGEPVRRILAKNCLFDPSRKIKINDAEGTVLIPILMEPKPEVAEALGKLGQVDLITATLPISKSPPKDLRGVLEGKLPVNLLDSLPKSYDVVGDILIIESMPPELMPHRKEIGIALLGLNSSVKTVLLKVGKVEGEFRVPRLEFLAGVEKYETIHLEYGVKLKVDVSKAYFSPRLGGERYRVSSSVSDGETVVDMFAGVGPFSIMIARKARARVYAIDLNSYAVKLIEANICLNRLKGDVLPFCGDARSLAKQFAGMADRVIMNLPGHSLEFLDVASKLVKKEGGLLHVYVFAEEDPLENAESDFRDAAKKLKVGFEIRAMRVVKPTAPREWQVVLDVWAYPK
jgi:tRNA (guanine37-N1)-methyltransferase